MSTQPTNPQPGDEAIDDLEVPADEADAVAGGVTLQASDDENGGETQAQMSAV
ncbi:MAG TPA: hypothetical protein VM942_02460 [Acidimicrobiales bacterium]|nr:hypothetical protein [Acidimicrobiales bacterium]